jgi:hypothetical protein
MADELPKVRRHGNAYIITCKAINLPPGTKNTAGHLHPDDGGPLPTPSRRWWLLLGGVALAAAAVGVVVGRFLL